MAAKNRSSIVRNNTTEEMFLLKSRSVPPCKDSIKDVHELELSGLQQLLSQVQKTLVKSSQYGDVLVCKFFRELP